MIRRCRHPEPSVSLAKDLACSTEMRDWRTPDPPRAASPLRMTTEGRTYAHAQCGYNFTSSPNVQPPASVFSLGTVFAGLPILTRQRPYRSEEHTSELQSRGHLVCRLLLEKKKTLTRLVQ